MTKTIRSTYPRDISVGMLIIIFGIVFFLSGQLFLKQQDETGWLTNIYFGEFLVSTATLTMVLILWEEILFPVKVRPVEGGVIFRNHRTKLQIQGLLYLIIPAIIVFLYVTFNVNSFRFFVWSGVCLILPVIGKLISGINNYNDFLTLTSDYIEFKDNEHEGRIDVKAIKKLEIVRDEHEELNQLKIERSSEEPVVIEIHQMELEAFYESIEEHLKEYFSKLIH